MTIVRIAAGTMLCLGLAACAPRDTAGDVACRSYGTSKKAMLVAEDYIAGRKSRHSEIVKKASWSNDPWTIQFSTILGGTFETVVVEMLPDGEVVSCSSSARCVTKDAPEKPACQASQKRLITNRQALEIAGSFLESQNIRPGDAHPPEIWSSPGWLVFVETEPPMPGGYYTLVISPDWEVLRTIPGE